MHTRLIAPFIPLALGLVVYALTGSLAFANYLFGMAAGIALSTILWPNKS